MKNESLTIGMLLIMLFIVTVISFVLIANNVIPQVAGIYHKVHGNEMYTYTVSKNVLYK